MSIKKRGLAVLLPLLLAVLLYGGGWAGQLLRNYDAFRKAGEDGAPALPSTDLFSCLKSVFTFPHGLYGFVLCAAAAAVLVFMVMRLGRDGRGDYDSKRNVQYAEKGTYGTSGFMTEKELPEVLELRRGLRSFDGTILGELDGQVVCVPRDSRLNRNIAVYGASGSMKSRTFARNMALQCVRRGESLILTDPKSELYESLAGYLEDSGYTVRVFNLIDPAHSDSWHCLAETEGEDIHAQLLSELVVGNEERGDSIWPKGEKALLKALALYVYSAFGEGQNTMGMVSHLLATSSDADLDQLFSVLPDEHPAKEAYGLFAKADEKVRSGITVGLGLKLQLFQNRLIREITSYREIDLELPGKQKCAYFCVFSDQDSTFEFLSSLFISFLFVKLVRYADRHGIEGRLPVPVHFLADELANVGSIPSLTKKISTIRSRNLSISCIFQNIAQMQNRYPYNAWQEILGGCDIQLFLGCTDMETARFVSERTGVASVQVQSEAKQLGTWRISDYTPEYRVTSSIGKRAVLTPDEVLRLPQEKALVIIRGQKVLEVDKYDFTRHPDAKYLRTVKASEHIPEWAGTGVDSSTTASPAHKLVKGKKPAGRAKVPEIPAAPDIVPVDKDSIML